MLITDELSNSLQNLNNSLNNVLNYSNTHIDDIKFERFLHTLEKNRFELYEQVKFLNNTILDNKIHSINDEYKANLKDNVLSLYVPEKLPNLINKSSYVNKQIILNIAEVTKPYKELFYDKFVIVIIKIYDKQKIWDVDNKTVKPIQDGLVHGGIIKDDNLFNCCYMVQGFYSDTPHIKVSVLEANDILDFIDFKLPNISK